MLLNYPQAIGGFSTNETSNDDTRDIFDSHGIIPMFEFQKLLFSILEICLF